MKASAPRPSRTAFAAALVVLLAPACGSCDEAEGLSPGPSPSARPFHYRWDGGPACG